MSYGVFLSYSRADDEVPPDDQAARGFVSFLHEQLDFEFKELGNPRPGIWRDRDNIRGGDQFNAKIAEAIAGCSLFVVVLSSNWLDSAYCRKELALFRERWAAEDDFTVRHRITVVHRSFVERERHPDLLTGQTGYSFFKFQSGQKAVGCERRFFRRGRAIDDAYYTVVQDLAVHLWTQLRSRSRKVGDLSVAPVRVQAEPSTLPPPDAAAPVEPVARARNGRTIYLAKASPEFEPQYQRIANELVHQGFEIRPVKNEEVPPDDRAMAFIDDAMKDAELSVHLVGGDRGFGGAGHDPLVKLQLSRAAAQVERKANAFRRIVWAPKIVETTQWSASPAQVVERDPVRELQAIDRMLPNDKVDGGGINDFVIFLLQNLREVPGQVEMRRPSPSATDTSEFYVHYNPNDRAFAIKVATALKKQGNVQPILAPNGEFDDRFAVLHSQRLKECDAVVLCWGAAPDIWAQSRSHELKDWQRLGRSRKFDVRGLVVGPPPGEDKEDTIGFWPKNEIDVIISLSQDGFSPEQLAELGIGAAG